MMLAVTACYTATSLSDKYAVVKAKFSGNEFTFLLCASMSVFLTFSLPFQKIHYTISLQTAISIILVVILKLLEFQMSVCVLKYLSAFELKAWLGVTLFTSYITDVCMGARLTLSRMGCIVLTVAGLFFIVKSTKECRVDYRKIWLPLFLYLCSKFLYGLVIRQSRSYISSGLQITIAMVLISMIVAPRVKLRQLFYRNPYAACRVMLARIPNTAGMIFENMIIAVSLTDYSFIQPMILVSLFVIGVIQKEKRTRLNLAGSVLCMIGIMFFQLCSG